MSSIEIPWGRIADLTIRPRLFSGEQEGSLGGPSLPIPRMGDRFAADVITTQFGQDDESRMFMAALFEASTSGARILLRQPNASGPTIYSRPVVDGSDAGGTVLAIRGLRAKQILSRGNFFSIVHRGVHYMHMIACAGQTRASADGTIALPIWPMLRFLTVDGEACVFDAPIIEGKLVGFDKGVSFQRNRTKPFTFSIEERA